MLESLCNRSKFVVACCVLLCPALPSLAHHSVRGTYDVDKSLTLVGTITKVELVNPHLRFELEAPDGAGGTLTWRAEMAGPSALSRRGMDPRTLLAVGERVTVEAWPAKDGSHSVSARVLVKPNGERFDVTDNWLGEMVEGSAVEIATSPF